RACARLLASRPAAREQSVDSRGLANPYPCPRDAGQVLNAQSDSEAPRPGRLALPNLLSAVLKAPSVLCASVPCGGNHEPVSLSRAGAPDARPTRQAIQERSARRQ